MILAAVSLPIMVRRRGKGWLRRNTSVRSSGDSIASSRPARACPSGSRFIQRAMEAAQSRDSTLVPSWNISPSRRRMLQRLPSSSITWPSAICGCGVSVASMP